MNRADFFIVPETVFSAGAHPTLSSTPFIQDDFVTVVSKEHPLASNKNPSREELLAEDYITYYPAMVPVDNNLLNTLSGKSPQGHKPVMQIQQFSLLPVVAIETGCAAILPRKIARYMQRYMPIAIVEEGPLPILLNLSLAWHNSKDRDPAHQWLKALLMEHCSQPRDD
ncbi:hypothetical protein HBA55_27970 [Pseudomaricurvus alkylphenolicus]|uniref:LysR substrate-binding domain-containing protein n=1 Tax=Pseudomaricurvus alkylphenolicus TaxID=1306991 RepID=UPI0014217A9D|nr:LysR substrate-binding domain-containing protein [Pseudomaricurvus alkylphenolicus]NIB43478.1 hypothetical protein [Pseudomaricurvus alkylphenolicus]